MACVAMSLTLAMGVNCLPCFITGREKERRQTDLLKLTKRLPRYVRIMILIRVIIFLGAYFQVKEIAQHNIEVLIDQGVQLNAMQNTAGMRSWVENLDEATKICVCKIPKSYA